MAVDLTKLATEINTDPAGKGYAPLKAKADDIGIANILNLKNVSGRRELTRLEYLTWLAGNGRWQKIEEAIVNAGLTQATRSACRAAIKLLDVSERNIDLDEANIAAMLNTLVTDSVLAAGDRTALLNLASTLISRAESLGIVTVKGEQVQPVDVGACR